MLNKFSVPGMDKARFIKATLLIIAEMFFAGAPFVVLYMVLNTILTDPLDIKKLFYALAILLVTFVVQSIVSIKGHINSSLLAFKTGGELRMLLGECLRKLPLGFFRRHDPGTLAETFLLHVSSCEEAISHLYTKLISSIALPCIVLSFLFVFEWQLALVLASTVIVAVIWMLYFRSALQKHSAGYLEARKEFSKTLLEYLQGIITFKAYNLTGREASRLYTTLENFCRQSIAFENLVAPMAYIFSMLLDFGLVLLFITGGWLLSTGDISEATMILFIVVSLRFYEPLHNLSVYYAMLRNTSNSLKSIMEILDNPPMSGTKTPDFSKGATISFTDVHFSYGKKDVLRGISLDIPAKSMTAVGGQNR